MARYHMQDGTVVDTSNATQSWQESRDHNGQNFISRATGSQWNHETLHKSRKGRYWKECKSDWQGSTDRAEWLSPQAAAAWLLLNDEEVPEDLAQYAEEVSE